MHAMFIDKIAFAYSVILGHVMMHMYFDLTLHCIVLHKYIFYI